MYIKKYLLLESGTAGTNKIQVKDLLFCRSVAMKNETCTHIERTWRDMRVTRLYALLLKPGVQKMILTCFLHDFKQ